MPPKAVRYDLTLTLTEVNELANLAGLFTEPGDGHGPIDVTTLERITSKLASARRREVVEDVVISARLLNALVETMQAVVQRYLPDDSPQSQFDTLNQLIGLLDGPSQRDAQGGLRKALERFDQ